MCRIVTSIFLSFIISACIERVEVKDHLGGIDAYHRTNEGYLTSGNYYGFSLYIDPQDANALFLYEDKVVLIYEYNDESISSCIKGVESQFVDVIARYEGNKRIVDIVFIYNEGGIILCKK